MNKNFNIENKLSKLFDTWYGSTPEDIQKLPHSGSSRTYYRLQKGNISAIGVYNNHLKENIAFIDFTKQFIQTRINVPKVYAEQLDDHIYLIQDLGDTQLLSWLISQKVDENFPDTALEIYKKVIQGLIQMQITTGRNFDYSKCYQFDTFNAESIIFDLNYFKTKYVDTLEINCDRDKIKKDFDLFSKYLLNAENSYFMFRDFQARNIILVEDQPYFIDYQGGRKGPLQYDLVSLLFQAKAQIPEETKNLLLKYYISLAQQFTPINKEEFVEYYFAFALVRVLQTLGAYGLRGLIEKKQHFIESIPLAINNLIYLKDKIEILSHLPELNQLINKIIKTNISNEK